MRANAEAFAAGLVAGVLLALAVYGFTVAAHPQPFIAGSVSDWRGDTVECLAYDESMTVRVRWKPRDGVCFVRDMPAGGPTP
jgi:hypothetical protein